MKTKAIVEAGGQIDEADEDNPTPLIHATIDNRIGILEYLIQIR